MKQYITWNIKPIDWWYEHPNTSDQDKKATWWLVNFIETAYWEEWKWTQIAIIEYDENFVWINELIAFANIKPEFEMQLKTEEEINEFLLSLYGWKVSVKDFIFNDTRDELMLT